MANAPRKPDQRSFYADSVSEAERAEFAAALAVDGVDGELATLRLLLRNRLKERPEDLALLMRGMDVLRRMVATRYGLSRADRRRFSAFPEETLRRVQERGEGREP